MRNKNILKKEDVVLVVIDVQERLISKIFRKEEVIKNIVSLLKFSKIVKIPVILTEQENLGQTISEIKEEVPDLKPIPKMTFNCFFNKNFSNAIKKTKRKTLVLTGIEAHICVAQTALYALSNFNVQVVADAVSSREPENLKIGLERMRQAGVIVTSTEMLIFEILKKAGTREFKETLNLIKKK